MSEEYDYYSRPGLSSSEIATFLSDPICWYHWYVAKDWTRPEPSAEMKLGTAVHKMIELDGWQDMVKEIPREVLNGDGHCKGKAWLEWKAENPCDVYLKPCEPNPLRVIWEHLQANVWTRGTILRSRKEVKHYWIDPDFGECKVKFDAVLVGEFVDWKTTSCRNARDFARDCYARSYDVRMAFYRRAFRDLQRVDLPDIFLVAIGTSGGMGVVPYQLSNAWLDDAEARLILAVDEMRRFNLEEYLDRKPQVLEQPRWSMLDLESVS